MPIIRREEVPAEEDGGVQRQPLAQQNLGAVSLTVTEVTLAPGGKIPLHTHPGHEECIVILDGTLEAVLGDKNALVVAGNTIIAPDGVKHSLTNTSNTAAIILAIFPTTEVQRHVLE